MKKLLLLFTALLFWTGSSWGQMPFESFENESPVPPEGWTVIYGDNNPTVNTVIHSIERQYDGDRSFRFSSYSSKTIYDQYLITPQLIVSEENQSFSFWHITTGNNNEDCRIGWSSTGKEIDDFTWAEEGISPIFSSWQQYSKTDLPLNTKYVAIHYYTINGYYVFIDHVVGPALDMSNQPDCAILTAPNSGATAVQLAATLNWASGGGFPNGYKLYFGTDNPPTSIVNGTDLGIVNIYDPELVYSTTYYWQVVPYNGNGNANGCPIWSFTTEADPILTPPFTEEFNTFLPANWTKAQGLLGETITLTGSSRAWAVDGFANVGTTGAARVNIYGSSRKEWLITSSINLGDGTDYRLTFDLALTRYGSTGTPEMTGTDDKFAVVISTDNGATWTSANTLMLWDNAGSTNVFNNISTTGEKIIIDLSSSYSGLVKIGFYGESTAFNADNDLFVDNVTIEEIPTTPLFAISPESKDFGGAYVGETSAAQTFTITNTGVGTLSIASNGITVSGTDANQFTLAAVSYPISLAEGESTTISVTFTPTSAGNKTANLNIVHNAPGSPSTVVLTGNALAAGSLFESFEGETFPPVGWAKDDASWQQSSGGYDGTLSAFLYSSGPVSDKKLITPRISLSGSESLTFYARNYTGSSQQIQIKYSANKLDWNDIGPAITLSPAFTKYVIDLSTVAIGEYYLAFSANATSEGFKEFYIDYVMGPVIFPEIPDPATIKSPDDAATGVWNNTTLSWSAGTTGGIPSGYKLYFGTDGAGISTPIDIENGTEQTSPYTPVSVLEYSTTYYWQVVPYNIKGDAPDCPIWSFTTMADPTIIPPFTEGFETGNTDGNAIANGWIQEAISGSENWITSDTATFYNRTPRTGDWNASLRHGNTRWMFRDISLEAGKNYTFDMFARQDGSDASDASITVSYGEAANSASMTNPIVTQTDITNGGYQLITGTFSPDADGVYVIGILGTINYSPYYISIDDISIYETPTCLAPYDLTVSNIIGITADLGWTERAGATNWNIKYGAPGFNPTTEGTLIPNIGTNPYAISGLTSNTVYDWYVQADCGSGDQSAWTGPKTFTTGYEYYTIPYTEGFETGHTDGEAIANDWIQERNGGKIKIWIANRTETGYNRTPRTGLWNAFLGNENSRWMFQKVELKGETEYTYDMYARQDRFHAESTSIIVSYGTASNKESMDMENPIVALTNIVDGNYQLITGTFTPLTDGVYSIGILASLNSLPTYISIDDISIYETPTCPAPLKLTIGNITASSADLGWTERGSAAAWNIKYGAPGFNPANENEGTLIPDGVTTNPYTLSGLDGNSTYEWYVQADCGSGDASGWAGPKTFTTKQVLATLPLTENFENWPNQWTIANGSEINQWHVGTATAHGGAQAAYVSNDAGVTNAYTINDASSVVHIYRDITFPEGAQEFNLSFWWKGVGESSYDYLKVYLVDVSYTPVAGVLPGTGQIGAIFNQANDWTLFEHELLVDYSGTTKRLVFAWENDYASGSNPPAAIDDISIYETNPATATFTGTGNWSNPANWNPGPPSETTDVTINGNVTVDNTFACNAFTISPLGSVTIDEGKSLTIGGNLLIQSDATGTGSFIDYGTFNSAGTTVERYLTGGWDDDNYLTGWHHISSPVLGQAISEFATGNYDFYGWEESNGTWINYKEAVTPPFFVDWNGDTDFNLGQGYLVSYEAPETTKTFTGVFNTNDVNKTNLTKSGDKYSGWNLLGNPFASSLTWGDGNWTLGDVAEVAIIWNNTGSYSDIINDIIPMAQGFMVQVNTTTSLTIPAASRVHSSQPFYKSGHEQLLLVAAETDHGTAQESKIMVNPMATEGFDFKYDSRFLAGYAPLFYSVVGDELLSTNSIPSIEAGLDIPFGFVKNAASAFTIELKESTASRAVYLTDKKTGTVTNLSEKHVYSFTSSAGDDVDRFLVSFGAVGIDQIAGNEGANAYAYDDIIYIETPLKERSLVNVFNISGQLVLQGKTEGSTLTTLDASSLQMGIYVVQVISNEKGINCKVFITK